MKKVLLSLLLATVIIIPVFAGGEKENVSEVQKIKIAVAEGLANDESATRKAYLQNYIAPRYNVSFMFSETLDDSGALLDFIDNAADAGCLALIDCSTRDYIGAARQCKKYNMWYVYNGTMYDEFARGDYDNVIAAWGQSQPKTAALFAKYLKDTATSTGEEGFCILSVNAPSGNTACKTIGTAALQAISELYNLAYDKPMDQLILSSTPIQATNDKGVKVFVFPGTLDADLLPSLSAVLQSGDYGYLIGTIQTYTSTAVIVDEIERSTKKNIKVMSPAAMTDSLLTAYKTKDMFGNPTLDFVTVKSSSIHGAVMFALAYNAITGHNDVNLKDGKVIRYTFNQFQLTSEEMVEQAASWDDPKTGNWVCDYAFVDALLYQNNPNLTSADIQACIDNVNYETIFTRLNK